MCSLWHQPLTFPLMSALVADPVLRLWQPALFLDIQDYVGVVLVRGLHLAEDDVPYGNIGFALLVDPLRCYSLDGVEKASVVGPDQRPHAVPRGHL